MNFKKMDLKKEIKEEEKIGQMTSEVKTNFDGHLALSNVARELFISVQVVYLSFGISPR